MSATLTFFKRKGDRQSDVFRGTSGGAGSSESTWEMIVKDKELKAAGIKFLVMEYANSEDLPEGYDVKVRRTPYLDLRWKEDIRNSVAYPGRSPLTLVSIKSWALELVEDFKLRTEHPSSTIEERIEMLEAKKDEPVVVQQQSSSASWVVPTVVTTSFLAIGLAAVVGSGADRKISQWAQYSMLDDDEKKGFYDTKGRRVGTPDVKWQIIDEETESLLYPHDDDDAEL